VSDDEDLVGPLNDLAEVLQRQRTLGGVLAGLAEAATLSVPRCDAASIAISIEGRPSTAAISARVALELDMVQYEAGDGPCISTFHSASALRIGLTEMGERFPHFARAAHDRGVEAVLSVPATWGHEVVATINLYSRSGPFDETAQTIAQVLASQVAMAVSRSPEFAAARSVVEQVQRDADDQAEVNMATGLLMINEACTAEQAQGLLRSAATSDAMSIVKIARRIIEQHRSSG
jgi:GAF domain-containing protein